jgi:hypothetical protein
MERCVGTVLECGAVCWDPHREGQVSALNWVQKRVPKFVSNVNESGWETLAQCRLIAQICTLFKICKGRTGLESNKDILLKLCYMSREDHNWKIRTRKQTADVGKYSFVNQTIRSWNQLLAGLLVSFSHKLKSLERGLRMQLQAREFKWGLSVNK